MKLAEVLYQGQQLQQQDRTLAIAYFEQCLQNTSINTSDLSSDSALEIDTYTKIKILLNLAAELIATKHPQSLQRAKLLVQQADASLIHDHDQDAESDKTSLLLADLLYVKSLIAIASGDLLTVLPVLQAAHTAYADNREGQALVDDVYGQYYLQTYDWQSALASFERSLSLRLEIGDEWLIAKSYGHLANLYLLAGDLDQASNLSHSILEIALKHSNNALRSQALKGLIKIAIAEGQWQDAIIMIKDAIALLKEPVDTIEIGYLYCDLAEALLGNRQVEDSLICIRIHVLPRFRDCQYQSGIAIAKLLRGRIYVYRLLEGLDNFDEDAIETVEDSLLDASIVFEQKGMLLDYGRSLYDLACLYQLCNSNQSQYQYQGKALRSLELALSTLDQIGMSNTRLASQIEVMLNQVMGSKF